MRLTAFFKLYKICILLHRCNLKILAKNRFETSAIFLKIQQHFANFQFCKIDRMARFLLSARFVQKNSERRKRRRAWPCKIQFLQNDSNIEYMLAISSILNVYYKLVVKSQRNYYINIDRKTLINITFRTKVREICNRWLEFSETLIQERCIRVHIL